ncbi:MAG: asparagine synthetase [glutamine-hydrolyzing] 1 [Bacteroidia bacterium]|nr:MAG: asparagine synthetase [glutamine-hydrolyzing] 1 [Bacteroidia bacterium]
MCGIAGVLTFDKNVDHERISALMIQSLKHRGPDATNVLKADAFCSLAHARLKIIDLSENANQPMLCYQNRYVIVFNGEIYNYQHLKLELQRLEYKSQYKPYPFQTKSDTEVILAAYHRWGKDCVKYLDGMFAFAIYDKHSHELFLARDRQGKKPLYYLMRENTFAFASEIRTLLNSNLSSRTLNLSQLYDYVQYQTTFAPHTFISDIQLLESGTVLQVNIQQEKLVYKKNTYWHFMPEKTLQKEDISYDEAKRKVRELLFNAVEKRLISDVPLGAFLSGGIDSSAIVGIMKNFLSSEVNTFHITTEVEEFAENQYAEDLAKIYGTKHHNIILKQKEVLNLVPEALVNMDYPTGDGINTYIVSKTTKQAGITVALSGVGGDELFAGYPQFQILMKFHKLDVIDFSGIRQLLSKCISDNLFSNAYRLKILMQSDSLSVNKLFPYYRHFFSNKNIPLDKNYWITHFNYFNSNKGLIKNKHILSYISLLEMHHYMQHVLLRDADQMSMAHALEVRAPFLDKDLVHFVLSLPDEYKYPTSPKRLLTESIKDILPIDIINRKKMGFVLPFKHWLRNELKSFCEENLKSISNYSFLNSEKIWKEWRNYQSLKHDRWYLFWHLIVLQNWIEKNNIKVE